MTNLDIYTNLLRRAQNGDNFLIEALCKATIYAYLSDNDLSLFDLIYNSDYYNILVSNPEACKKALNSLESLREEEVIKFWRKLIELSANMKEADRIKNYRDKTIQIEKSLSDYCSYLKDLGADKIEEIDKKTLINYKDLYCYLHDFVIRLRKGEIKFFINVDKEKLQCNLGSFISPLFDVLSYINKKDIQWFARSDNKSDELLLKIDKISYSLEKKIFKLLIVELWLLHNVRYESLNDIQIDLTNSEFFVQWERYGKIDVTNAYLDSLHEDIKKNIVSTLNSSDSGQESIIQVIGPPASGKTTLISQVKKEVCKSTQIDKKCLNWIIFDISNYSTLFEKDILLYKAKEALLKEFLNRVKEYILQRYIYEHFWKESVFACNSTNLSKQLNDLCSEVGAYPAPHDGDYSAFGETLKDEFSASFRGSPIKSTALKKLKEQCADVDQNNQDTPKMISIMRDYIDSCSNLASLHQRMIKLIKDVGERDELNKSIAVLIQTLKLENTKLLFIFDEFDLYKDNTQSKWRELLLFINDSLFTPFSKHAKGSYWILATYDKDEIILFSKAEEHILTDSFSIDQISRILNQNEATQGHEQQAYRIWYWTRGHPALTIFLIAAYVEAQKNQKSDEIVTIDDIALSEASKKAIIYVIKEKTLPSNSRKGSGSKKYQRWPDAEKREYALAVFQKAMEEIPPIIMAHIDSIF